MGNQVVVMTPCGILVGGSTIRSHDQSCRMLLEVMKPMSLCIKHLPHSSEYLLINTPANVPFLHFCLHCSHLQVLSHIHSFTSQKLGLFSQKAEGAVFWMCLFGTPIQCSYHCAVLYTNENMDKTLFRFPDIQLKFPV